MYLCKRFNKIQISKIIKPSLQNNGIIFILAII
jgi:hypothetical protein